MATAHPEDQRGVEALRLRHHVPTGVIERTTMMTTSNDEPASQSSPQEVEDRVFTKDLFPFFSSFGFEGYFQPRQLADVTGPIGPPEGTALFYRTSMFRPLDHLTEGQVSGEEADKGVGIEFSRCELPEGVAAASPLAPAAGEGDPRELVRGGMWDTFYRRTEGALIAVLEHVPTSSPVVVACTHLFWNPYYPDVKALQAAVLCAEVSQLSVFLQALRFTFRDLLAVTQSIPRAADLASHQEML